MCRNIRTLHNFDPPATADEIQAASLQFVRKLSGFTKPSQANEVAFSTAVEEVSICVQRLIDSLSTIAPPKDRDTEARKAKAFLSPKELPCEFPSEAGIEIVGN